MVRSALILPLAFAAFPAAAQSLPTAPEGLDVSGSIRLRYEVIADQARAGVPADEASTQLRTILHATYRTGPVTFGGEVDDSRALDVPRPTAIGTNEVNALEPVEAWVAVDLGKADANHVHGRLALGRFMLDLGSRRLVARDDYRNTTNGFTGIRLDLTASARTQGTFFYVLPQQRLPDDAAGIRDARIAFDHEGFDMRLWGARIARAGLPGKALVEATFYRFEERDAGIRATRDRHLSSYGLRLIAAPRPRTWDYEVEGIRQTGSISASLAPNAARLPVEAWFAHARVGYQWPGTWQPRLAVEADYASGDKRNGTYGRFDTLFGMRRADFSPAGLYNAVSRSNLIAIGPRIELTPDKRVDAFLTVKKLWLASAVDAFATTGVVDPAGHSGRDAGWQTDARLRFWALPKRVQLEADGTWLAKGRFLATAPNRASSGDTLYLSLNAIAFF